MGYSSVSLRSPRPSKQARHMTGERWVKDNHYSATKKGHQNGVLYRGGENGI